ncbi:MAG: diaminobutyrate--2-oxoglutarate transaminase [Proteobacteria bacterium]|nr:diaminobutyrate--2-oxoglutarate transaminase [Pseudomonadota bacterium]
MTNISQDPSHRLESSVRSYSRSFPFKATKALGSKIYSESGEVYLDFLSGAGSLNYGHNNPKFKDALLQYIEEDSIIHGLDMATKAKDEFIETFSKNILKPRDLDYRIQFCGPTGTNAVEAAIKLARLVTQRVHIISFTNGFHGMTSGALAVTGNNYHKEGIPGTHSQYTTFMPYCNYSDNVDDSIAYIRQYLKDNSSGVNMPAAIILESVQGEGGVNVASPRWLRGIRKLCDDFGILLIIDDIQMGCGRTGDFFSFEESGIQPDITLLSKSIGAYGLPMALVLLKPEIDLWKPAQHNGTFRGNNLAFVAAKRAIEEYWSNDDFSEEIKEKSKMIEKRFQKIAKENPEMDFDIRGRGLVFALESNKYAGLASDIQKYCFKRNMIIETCGSADQALKPLPALTITKKELNQGLDIIEESVNLAIGDFKENQSRIVSIKSAKL